MNLNDDQAYVLEHLKSKDPKLLRQLHKSGELEEYCQPNGWPARPAYRRALSRATRCGHSDCQQEEPILDLPCCRHRSARTHRMRGRPDARGTNCDTARSSPSPPSSLHAPPRTLAESSENGCAPETDHF